MCLGIIASMIMMDINYLLTPFLAWFVAGGAKFLINCVRSKQLAWHLIGYGGMPSNHSAIVSSMATLIALKEGINHPAFGVSITLAFIVILDASSLRRQIGKHAKALNDLTKNSENKLIFRERIGHSLVEIIAGIITGIISALIINYAYNI